MHPDILASLGQNRNKYDLNKSANIKLLGCRILIWCTLALSLVTLLASLAFISQLMLIYDRQQLDLLHLREINGDVEDQRSGERLYQGLNVQEKGAKSRDDNVIIFNGHLATNTLVVGDRIKVARILGNERHLLLSANSSSMPSHTLHTNGNDEVKDRQEGRHNQADEEERLWSAIDNRANAEIRIDHQTQSVSMQASMYQFGVSDSSSQGYTEDDPHNQEAPRIMLTDKVVNLEVKGEGLHNIQLIRTGPSRAASLRRPTGSLSFSSEEDLQVSGNLGLGLHARKAEMTSSRKIELTSGDGSISLAGLESIRLPNVEVLEAPMSSRARHEVCISAEDGLVDNQC